MGVTLAQARANAKAGINSASDRIKANSGTNAYTNPSYYNYKPSVASSNLTTTGNVGTKTLAEKNVEREAEKYAGGYTGNAVENTTNDSDVLDAYYQALADRLNAATNSRNAYLNALYSDQQKDINGRYSRLKRELTRRAVNNGQDPYVTNAWNVDFAKDTSQRELDKSKLEAEANNANYDYSNYNSLYNSLLNSSASTEAKKKILGIA